VQTLELNGPAQVRVTGMVWQRFPKGAPTEARGGVIFPEAVSGDVDKPLEREDGKDVIQYSSFKVVLKQRLVSSPNYPFDHAQVRIWIRPKAISGNEILVPDLGAYERLEPTALPGLDRESGVLGWNVEKSFFSYMFQSYNANFGMQNFVGQQDSPELIFNVALKRQFLNPFIATFLPILAVVGLLFAGVMTISGNPERIKATGYQCLTFQRHAATLLFPLLVAQVNLRSKIEADRLVYLEHYYFVVYGLILLVVTSALAFALSDRRVLNRMDNALVKLGFWPLLFVSFYAISTQFLL
jgi:hypothetical protein